MQFGQKAIFKVGLEKMQNLIIVTFVNRKVFESDSIAQSSSSLVRMIYFLNIRMTINVKQIYSEVPLCCDLRKQIGRSNNFHHVCLSFCLSVCMWGGGGAGGRCLFMARSHGAILSECDCIFLHAVL